MIDDDTEPAPDRWDRSTGWGQDGTRWEDRLPNEGERDAETEETE